MSDLTVRRAVEMPDPLRIGRYRRAPEFGPRVLFFSGGTALTEISRALKYYTHNSIHLVTPFDSGGSSAKLRQAFDMPSIGDLRSRLMALADEAVTGYPEIYRLFGYRLPKDAIEFMDDVAMRLANRVQLTTDGHKAYLEAVEGAFGGDVDYAQLVKLYGSAPENMKGKYSPAECTGTRKRRIEGKPSKENVSTSYVERQNLTMRMHMRRFTRLTNAFSKKVENHAYAVALHMTYYNFVRQHKSLNGLTPAMVAGVSDRLWEMSDIVALVEAAEPKPEKRGPYKKRKAKNSN